MTKPGPDDPAFAAQSLKAVAEIVSRPPAQRQLPHLVEALCGILGVDYAVVGEADPKDPALFRSVAGFHADGLMSPVSHVLAGTPCEEVLRVGEGTWSSDVQSAFPEFGLLAELGIAAYIAVALVNSRGESIGLLAVMHCAPIKEVGTVSAAVQILGAYASRELEWLSGEEDVAFFRHAVASSDDAIAFVDSGYRYRVVNAAYSEIFGCQPDEMVGQDVRAAFGDERFEREIQPVLDRGLAGEVARAQLEFVEPDGSIRIQESIVSPSPGPNSFLGITVVSRNVTAQVSAERDRAELVERMLKGQKTDALALVTGGIAHEFNNVLAVLLGFGRMGMGHAQTRASEDLSRYFREIVSAGQRAEDIVRELLKFSRSLPGQRENVDLGTLIEQATQLLRPAFPSSVHFRQVVDDAIPPARVDASEFQQVLVNLLVNARDAMSGSGTVTIEARRPAHHEGFCDSCHQFFDQKLVRLVVRDQGSGVHRDDLPRIFDPFFTTKPVNQGRGLGLSAVHGIVHDHGGHVQVSSGPDLGCSVTLLLPTGSDAGP
ncbi:MAG: PAS domain-containing protein [Gammaproteobacteria bacterium]|nr:PAS domain-containing protein [Gammaproteobacteria bacterium]